jgi:beta-hydroxyacyl-ACP dehydratase FabZ
MEMDILQVMKGLPHRYPFLLVDRILECTSDEVVGLKNVTINEPFFQGHFPIEPIMPGVLVVEAMAQAGGILAFSLHPEVKDPRIYFMGIDKVRFRRPIRPGDQIILRLKLLRKHGAVFKMQGQAFVENQLAAEAELTATIDAPKTQKES